MNKPAPRLSERTVRTTIAVFISCNLEAWTSFGKGLFANHTAEAGWGPNLRSECLRFESLFRRRGVHRAIGLDWHNDRAAILLQLDLQIEVRCGRRHRSGRHQAFGPFLRLQTVDPHANPLQPARNR